MAYVANRIYDEDFIKQNVIVTEDGCWEWQMSRNELGYGRVNPNTGELKAHRLAFKLFKGPIPAYLIVRHTCDNPPCCNPEHLVLGSQNENMIDCVIRGRHKHDNGVASLEVRRIPQLIVEDVISSVTKGERKPEIAARLKIGLTTVYRIINAHKEPHMANPNFSTILEEAPTEVKVPPPMPAGTYTFIVQGQPRYDKSSKKGTDFVEFILKPIAAESDVDEEELEELGGLDGKTVKATFYLTDDAVFLLDQFHEHCGLDLSEAASRKARNDEVVNAEVRGYLKHEASQDGSRTFAKLARTLPAG